MFASFWTFFSPLVPAGIDHKRTALKSKAVEHDLEETATIFNIPMDTGSADSTKAENDIVDFDYSMFPSFSRLGIRNNINWFWAAQTYGLEPEANYAASSSTQSPAGQFYYDRLPTDPESSYYTPLPLAEITAASNLFPQTFLAPQADSLKLPVSYDTQAELTTDSGLGFFAMADDSDPALKVTDHVDYHSSDHIFDHFNATFGSLEDAY